MIFVTSTSEILDGAWKTKIGQLMFSNAKKDKEKQHGTWDWTISLDSELSINGKLEKFKYQWYW